MVPLEWLIVTSSVLTYYSAVVATGSLVVASLSFRAARPRLVLRASAIYSGEGATPKGIELTADNSGNGAVTIDILECQAFRIDNPFAGPMAASPVGRVEGPPLPFRLDGNSSCQWQLIDSKLEHILWRYQDFNTIALLVKKGGRRKPRTVVVTIPRSQREKTQDYS